MKRSYILHIAYNEKFIPPFIDFIQKYFNSMKHSFLLLGKKEYKYGLCEKHAVKWINQKNKVFLLIKEMYVADKIIIHGLWSRDLINLLFLQPWLLKKCYWLIWGGDLYAKGNSNWIKKKVIKNIGTITTTVPGDYELAVLWYKTKAKYIENLMYKSHTYRDIIINCSEDNTINIQIGNSADASNNHYEIINKLLPFVNSNIKVFCPLSYGDPDYKKQVIKYGREKIGDIFIPLTEFISYDEYNVYLSKIDIAIFNHDRQQAMGNIIALLSLGKKVYINSYITPYLYFKEKDFKIFGTDLGIDLVPISQIDVELNIINAKKYFNEEVLIENWKKVFDEEL